MTGNGRGIPPDTKYLKFKVTQSINHIKYFKSMSGTQFFLKFKIYFRAIPTSYELIIFTQPIEAIIKQNYDYLDI